jgi:PAS domain-containing protein
VQSELTFHHIIDGISALVAVLTPDGEVEFVNEQVLDYFGKTLEELKRWASTETDPVECLLARLRRPLDLWRAHRHTDR